jgi:hypothetical protein
VLSGPALAAGPGKQVFFNVVDATHIALLATAVADGTFLAVDVLPSRFVGGTHLTFGNENVPGPGPGGLWEIPRDHTTVIPIPATGVNYDVAKGGFAAVRALAVDDQGSPSPNDVVCYVALNRPAYMGSVSGSALPGNSFQVAVPAGLRNQAATLCVTLLGGADVIVRDRGTNTLLLPQSSVLQNHTLVVEAAVDEATVLEVGSSGGTCICSALIRRGPNRTRRLRVYPTKLG